MVLIVFLKVPLWECFWGEKATTSFCNLISNKQDKVDKVDWRVKWKLIWTQTERIPTAVLLFLVHSGLSSSAGGFLPVNPSVVFGGVWQNAKVGQEGSGRLYCQTISFRDHTKNLEVHKEKKLEGSKLRPREGRSMHALQEGLLQTQHKASDCCHRVLPEGMNAAGHRLKIYWVSLDTFLTNLNNTLSFMYCLISINWNACMTELKLFRFSHNWNDL